MALFTEMWVAEAKKYLAHGERVDDVVSGRIMSTGVLAHPAAVLIATDWRLVLFELRVSQRHRFESFPYESISSFQSEKLLFGYTYRFFSSGNAVEVARIRDDPLQAFANLVQGRIRAGAPRVPPSGSAATELAKFGELLSKGLITQEEFNQQKRRILGSSD
ncbi:hypothetical protein GCM10027447_02180 [Glycomyces halotolerans]